LGNITGKGHWAEGLGNNASHPQPIEIVMFDTLLAWVALGEGLGIFILAGLILLHALGLSLLEKHSRRRVERARARLLAHLEAEDVPGKLLEHLRALTRGQQIRLFSQIIPSLKGARRDTLTWLAGDIGLTGWAEKLCGSRLWWRRLQGIRLLTLLGGGEEVVPALLKDLHPAVRCQAAEWATDHPTPAVVNSLIEMLDNRRDPARFSIQDSLLRMGYPASEPLREALNSSRTSNLVGVLEVAIGLASPQFLTPALGLCSYKEPTVRTLAAKLLGALGGGEAAKVLTGMLSDQDPQVRQAAAAALGNLGHWPAATAVAGLLRDPVWGVRREAGLALRSFGAPGHLILRRSLSDEWAPAAEMAKQVLDTPNQPWPAF